MPRDDEQGMAELEAALAAERRRSARAPAGQARPHRPGRVDDRRRRRARQVLAVRCLSADGGSRPDLRRSSTAGRRCRTRAPSWSRSRWPAPNWTGPIGAGSTSPPGPAARPRCWGRGLRRRGQGRRGRDHPAPCRTGPQGRRRAAGGRAHRRRSRPRSARGRHSTGCCWTRPAPDSVPCAAGRKRAGDGSRATSRRWSSCSASCSSPPPGCVRPGGLVAYVTCSPHLSETAGVIARRPPDLELIDARPYLPGVPDLGDGPTVQLWPHRHGTDGMFLALMRRRSEPRPAPRRAVTASSPVPLNTPGPGSIG